MFQLSLQDLKAKIHKNTQKQWFKLYEQIKGSIKSKYKRLLQNQQMRISILQKNIVRFGGYSFTGRSNIFKTLKQSNIRLKLSQIENIYFCGLRVLNFSNCHLDNIEALSWLNLQQINILNLDSNYIVSLKPFSKTSLAQLHELKLGRNILQYTSTSHLSRLHSSKLKLIDFCCNLYQILLKNQYGLVNFIEKLIRSFFGRQILRVILNRSIQRLKQTAWSIKVGENSLISLIKY